MNPVPLLRSLFYDPFAAAIAAQRGITEFQILRGDERLKVMIDLRPQ